MVAQNIMVAAARALRNAITRSGWFTTGNGPVQNVGRGWQCRAKQADIWCSCGLVTIASQLIQEGG